MPKIVEHDKRKEELAEAAWRVIRRDGIEHASVRSIAQEAGMSVGSMRHYFSTQSELFAFSMNLVAERVNNRISAVQYTGHPIEDMKMLLFELMPMDEERHAEMEVWFAFTVKALSDPELHALNEKIYLEMRTGMSRIIGGLVHTGLAAPDLNQEVEIERLSALVDGLSVHRIIQPNHIPIEMLHEVIVHHLESLCQKGRL